MSVRWIRVDTNTSTGDQASYYPETYFDKIIIRQDDVNLFSIRGVKGATAHIINFSYPSMEAALVALQSMFNHIDVLGSNV